MDDNNVQNSKVLSEKVYKDEPIFFTGSELLNFKTNSRIPQSTDDRVQSHTGENKYKRVNLLHDLDVDVKRSKDVWSADNGGFKRKLSNNYNNLPKQLREFRAFDDSLEAKRMTRTQRFFVEAQMLADYEDDFDKQIHFNAYYPTYSDLTNDQLRCYFSWRTQVRANELKRTSVSYVYLYIYEILNGINTKSPIDAIEKIFNFWEEYLKIDPLPSRYIYTWIVDYTIFYSLDRSFIERAEDIWESVIGKKLDKTKSQNTLNMILEYEKSHKSRVEFLDIQQQKDEKERLAKSIEALSAFKFSNCQVYKDSPDLVNFAVCNLWDKLTKYYKKHRKLSLIESLFGAFSTRPIHLFPAAVFYDDGSHADAEYHLNNLTIYSCKHGHWSCSTYHDMPNTNKELGEIIDALIDRLRCTFGDEYILGQQIIEPFDASKSGKRKRPKKYLEKIIDEAILNAKSQLELLNSLSIDIDSGHLDEIRRIAAQTRDLLLIDEECVECSIDSIENTEDSRSTNTPGAFSIFSDLELAYLQSLLNNESSSIQTRLLAKENIFESIFVESLNEKLLDEIGDIAIVESADGYELIEDYIDDIKDMM